MMHAGNKEKSKTTDVSYIMFCPLVTANRNIKLKTSFSLRVPYMALAKTMEAIENISARLKIIEILSNYFRSVIVLTPEDLLPSVYLCLNKLAPAYEGIHTC